MEGTEDFFATLSIPASSVYLGVSAGSVDSVTVSTLDDDNVMVGFSMTGLKCLRVLVGCPSIYQVTLLEQSTTPCWCTSAIEQLRVSTIHTLYIHECIHFECLAFFLKTEPEKCLQVAYLTVRNTAYNFVVITIICTLFHLAAT